MAQYINETILATYMGAALVNRIEEITGVTLATTIAQASDIIGGYLRNNGYTVPTTSTPGDIADTSVHAATVAVVWEALASIPEASVPLPSGWATHPCVLARDGILSGAVTLNLERSTAASVGGFLGPDQTSDVADGGRPQRASREELSGY